MNDIEERFKNTRRSRTLKRIIKIFGLSKKEVLDLGCGFGEQLSLFGRGSVGVTTNELELTEGNKRGLIIVKGNIEEPERLQIKKIFDIIWANNFLEHILSPHAFLSKLRSFVQGSPQLILGVPVVPFPTLLLRVNKFRGALASNHISFFTRKTLLLTVESAGWNIQDVRPFIVSYAPFDRLLSFFAPHLYVVAEKNSKFIYAEKKLQEWRGIEFYNSLLRGTDQI